MPGPISCEDALVRITSRHNNALGTGFVVRHEGTRTFILTCKHVVDDTAAKDDASRTVLIDQQYEAKPCFESATATPDLSVLVAEAAALRKKPALPLGRMTYSLDTWVAGYWAVSDQEGVQPRIVRYEMASPTLPLFILKNDRGLKIVKGHSGSPVLDLRTGCVIGVVTATPYQLRKEDNRDETVIEASAIQLLEQIWQPTPPGLIVDVDSSVRTEFDPDLLARVQKAGPLRLRVLLAASRPTPAADVNYERATVESLFDQILVRSALARCFDLEVYECVDGEHVRQVLSTRSVANGPVKRPDLSEFDLVIIIAWHNPGGAGLDLRQVEREARQSAAKHPQRRPVRLLYFRQDPIHVAINDSSEADQKQEYARTETFSRDLNEGGIPYTVYRHGDFNHVFAIDFRRVIEEFADAECRLKEGSQRAPGRGEPAIVNPYLGLRPYGLDDAGLFFGRVAEIEHLCERLAPGKDGFIAVVGASGVGKSSLVRAGLLHRLTLDAIPGSRSWTVVDFSLRYHAKSPLGGMATRLLTLLDQGPRHPYQRLDRLEQELGHPSGIDAVARCALARSPADARLMLFVDQFEELFTLVPDPAERNRFARFLADALQSPRINALITLRADYYDRVLQLKPLAEIIGRSVYSPPAPQPAALLTMITRPPLFCGLRFEDAHLPFEILRDAGNDAGTLPLLSYALEQLADPSRLAGHVITRAAYSELQGVQGAIQKQADAAIQELRGRMDTGQVGRFSLDDSLNTVFRKLVRVDESGQAARQPAPKLPDDPSWTYGARCVVDELVDLRLLQQDRMARNDLPSGFVPTVEIAHEALLTQWRQLREWITGMRESLLVLHRTKVSAREWQATRSQAPTPLAALDIDRDLLWPDSRLQLLTRALHLLGTDESELDEVVRTFVRPERERLVKELTFAVNHVRRAWIGDRLAELGDPRPGVGVRADTLPDLLWCPVPAGKVLLDCAPSSFSVRPFYIAKYPVTLAQFNVFARSEAYDQERWWHDLPVQPRAHPPIQQFPEISNRPAQFVSWYQAVAYCRWLSHALGYAVRLPTEWEWQQAATGGRADYLYPWGPDWNPDFANTRELGVNSVVSVGLYPHGASPVGALDMSGNMYEWCQNEYDDLGGLDCRSTNPRTTRGGAYSSFGNLAARDAVKVTARLRDNAHGYNDRGDRTRVCIRLACDDLPPEALPNPLR